MTAMIVLFCSKATKDLLKSFGWGIAGTPSIKCSDEVVIPRRPLHSVSRSLSKGSAGKVEHLDEVDPLSSTLVYMAVKRDARIKSATYFVTMVDFAEAGELSVFIDEEQLAALEQRMNAKGYLDGRDMATPSFALDYRSRRDRDRVARLGSRFSVVGGLNAGGKC
jgi:hypothetical protein